ncbi:NADH-quinone oxidoreductase subunit J [Thioflexithrix psekupsensis]|uniref:NADH-quinone oxidoreductase subunit J n=1 Tax=Thioflexithrix psekupsensis TaxID=1570016 RepID=A0A251XA08_9GAMM|nr:NADH-quinone oxidoreductase subunit J [Thioflexithrix psekupsensis]OUD15080.1 NADH:ubiquinone oxidoreductase subunit J [Thioflexithrix psekupsensis]
MIKLIFYLFALILVFSASRVITVRNPVHAALFLVLAFFSSAAIWLLLHAEFLAIALVLVYVGAVMVLFLFVVMMLDINLTPLREGFARYLPIGALVGLLILLEMVLVVGAWKSQAETLATQVHALPNTEQLGMLLYSVYLYPFEIAAAILLVAMIAAIVLTMRTKRQTKTQKPEQQVAVRRADRVRLVEMPAQPRD